MVERASVKRHWQQNGLYALRVNRHSEIIMSVCIKQSL